jgi:alpha-glucosidase (family GH31 glycosyl hydrolase)
MRNHYAHLKNPQEFYVFDDPYKSGMKQSLRQRYSLMKYMYTVLYQSSRDGTPTIRHLMYDTPDVSEIVNNEDSFMFGKHLRITANFDSNSTPQSFSSSFTQGVWVDYNTYEYQKVTEKVTKFNLFNGWNYTNLHVKGGAVIPFQNIGDATKTTSDLLAANLNLMIVPTENGYAEGQLFLADGVYIDEPYQYFTIIHADKVIQFKLNDGEQSLEYKVDEIHIIGDENITDSDFI